MINHNRTPANLAAIALLFAACLSSAALSHAQAPPGPLPQTESQDPPPPPPRPQVQKAPVEPRTSIFGAWKLDRDDSDDPQKKLQQAQQDQSNGGYGNRRMGGGYPGGGGGYPGGGGGMGGGGRRMGQQGESDEDRQRMQDLVNPPNTFTLAEAKKDVEVDSFDDEQHKRAFFTDGRKVQKSKDVNYQEITAHWDGNRLATDEKKPGGGKMSRTYELSYDGTQLYETLHLTGSRSNSTVTIRFVYDQSGAAPVAAATAAPATTSAPAPKQ